MKLREHRGSYEESMATVVDIEPSLEVLTEYIRQAFGERFLMKDSWVHVDPYGGGMDHRNGWDTYIVWVENYGVFGFTDGPINDGHLLGEFRHIDD